MKQRPRIYYSASHRAVIWDRWQKGETLHQIAGLFDRYHSSIQRIVAETGGIRPANRHRSSLALTITEREEISRGIVAGRSICSIAATLVERQSRYVMLAKLAGKDTETVVNALIKHTQKLPHELYKSLTWDRGKEMAGHQRFTLATDIKVYFCDPQSPWQRGSNENANGLLRQYLPKLRRLTRDRVRPIAGVNLSPRSGSSITGGERPLFPASPDAGATGPCRLGVTCVVRSGNRVA